MVSEFKEPVVYLYSYTKTNTDFHNALNSSPELHLCRSELKANGIEFYAYNTFYVFIKPEQWPEVKNITSGRKLRQHDVVVASEFASIVDSLVGRIRSKMRPRKRISVLLSEVLLYPPVEWRRHCGRLAGAAVDRGIPLDIYYIERLEAEVRAVFSPQQA